MAVTDEQIQEYLAANPNITDEELYAVMTQHRLTPEDIQGAVGGNLEGYQARYDAQAAAADPQDPTDAVTALLPPGDSGSDGVGDVLGVLGGALRVGQAAPQIKDLVDVMKNDTLPVLNMTAADKAKQDATNAAKTAANAGEKIIGTQARGAIASGLGNLAGMAGESTLANSIIGGLLPTSPLAAVTFVKSLIDYMNARSDARDAKDAARRAAYVEEHPWAPVMERIEQGSQEGFENSSPYFISEGAGWIPQDMGSNDEIAKKIESGELVPWQNPDGSWVVLDKEGYISTYDPSAQGIRDIQDEAVRGGTTEGTTGGDSTTTGDADTTKQSDPLCPVGQHWDPTQDKCVPDTTTITTTGGADTTKQSDPLCPVGQHWDPTQDKCVPDVVPPPPPTPTPTPTPTPATKQSDPLCPVGQHWDSNQDKCVPDVVLPPPPTPAPPPPTPAPPPPTPAPPPPTPAPTPATKQSDPLCPVGQHWDSNQDKCVPDVVPPPPPTPTPTTTPTSKPKATVDPFYGLDFRTVTTEPGDLADIKYLYDIGGESIFAPQMAEEDNPSLYSTYASGGKVAEFDIVEEALRLLRGD